MLLHPMGRRGIPGTQNLDPGPVAGCIGTLGTHGAAPITQLNEEHTRRLKVKTGFI